MVKKCINCGKDLHKGIKYCSNKCQSDYIYKNYIQRWQNGTETGLKGEYQISNHLRRYLFEKNNNKCELCGWGEINPFSNTIPLEIHHIDGDYTNNHESNLQLLCPNCHSLTETTKRRGKGRKGRKKYYDTRNQ